MILKRIIFILISLFIIGTFLFNFQNYQKLNFYNEKFLKESSELNKEIFLLKEIAVNLEKFRLFFEPIYLEEIKKLVKESKILKDNILDSLLIDLIYLTLSSKGKKNNFNTFVNFREYLRVKEKFLKEELTKLEKGYRIFKEQKVKELNFINMIILVGLFMLIGLVNIFSSGNKKKNRILNSYFSLLEALKIVKEKIDGYLEKINSLENNLKEVQKLLTENKNLENLQILNNYKKIFTYSLLNLQLGLLQNDQLLVSKYFTNFTEISEKIINLLSLDGKEKLITYFKESEEELNFFKEELSNLKKVISEIKNYEVKNDY